MQSFAEALRKRAQQLGLSNAEVARRANLTERRYGNYVAGVREPDLATLGRIATALGVTPDALLGFAEASAKSAGDKLLERLVTGARALGKGDLEVVIVQIEALAAHRNAGARRDRLTKRFEKT